MSAGWALTPLRKALKRVERFEPRLDLVDYPFAGTYSYARGVFVSERKLGASFKLPKVQRIRAGDFVYCKIMAWEGAFGTVPMEADGCVMSGAFVAYEPVAPIIEPKFLDWYFRTPSNWQRVGRQSTGTNVRRQSLHPEQFEATEIPLPPIDEQRRIVARIEELAAKVEEARGLRSSTANEANHVWQRYAARLFSSSMPIKPPSLDDVTHIVGGQSLPEMVAEPSEAGDVHLVKVSDMNRAGNETYIYSSALSLFTNSPLLRGIRLLPNGAVILPKRGGAIATNKKRILTCSAALDPNLMGIFPRNDSDLSSSYLFAWLKTIDLASMQDGTSVPQINKGDLAPLAFPLVPLIDQQRIVAELDALQAKVDAVKALQTETAAELDAMLPAILDKAFKGELV